LSALAKTIIKDTLRFILFVGTGFGILYLVYNNQNKAYKAQCVIDGIPLEECSLIGKVFADFQTVHVVYLLLVMFFFNVSNIARAMRWKLLLESMGYKVKTGNAFLTVMLSYFANLGLPRIGEVLRGTTFAKYEGIRVEKVMGTIVMDRLLDMLCVLIIVVLAIALEFDLITSFIAGNTAGKSPGTLIFWIIGSFLVLFMISWLFRARWSQWRIVIRIKSLLLGFLEGIRSIQNVKKPFAFALYSISIWLMYFLMTWVCFFAFDPTAHLSLKAGLIVFVFGTFGVIIPSPGGMGTFHALAVIALSFYSINGDDAFSFANILFFTVQIGCTILLGIISIILLPIINKNYNPIENKELDLQNRIHP
jgi:uncharacterized protein (TIRG00374 family)